MRACRAICKHLTALSISWKFKLLMHSRAFFVASPIAAVEGVNPGTAVGIACCVWERGFWGWEGYIGADVRA